LLEASKLEFRDHYRPVKPPGLPDLLNAVTQLLDEFTGAALDVHTVDAGWTARRLPSASGDNEKMT
jgi:hypothetical protein